jgi:hypothetical protein
LKPKWWKIQVSKAVKIIKVYLTKPNWSSTAEMPDKKELGHE